jgi:hypothetical protein
MGTCEICGKPTALHFHFCQNCSYKIQTGYLVKCQKCGKWKKKDEVCQECEKKQKTISKSNYPNCKKTVESFFGKEMMFDSKEEIKIAEILIKQGYKFDHDQEYPYKENENGLRYDFKLLKQDGTDFKKRIFIEVKCDKNQDHTKKIIEKQRMCLDNNDDLIYSNKNKEAEILEDLQKAIERIKRKKV